jgi:general secretion pathway protein C
MPLDRSLRRSFWLVPAPLLALAAFWNAQAVTELIGVGMAVDATMLAKAPPRAARLAPSASARATSAAPILARNPFDHVTGPLVAPAAVATDASGAPIPEADTGDPWSAPTCEGVDVNAIAASEDTEWSFASLSGSDKKRHLLRRGGEIADKKVTFIGWDRLWLTGAGGLCQAILFDAKKAPPPKAPVVAPTTTRVPTRRGAKPLDPELRKGIQAVSATEFNIDRSVVDRILENQSELMRQAKIIPVQENGRTVGVRLLGIRPDALLGVLGMKNNDHLQTINGFEVANPEKALEAYARLRTADKLTIQVNRDGKNMNLDYNIR